MIMSIVGWIEDPRALAQLKATAQSDGAMLVCHRCQKPQELVKAILLLSAGEELAVALCGCCLRRLFPQDLSYYLN